MVRFGLHYADRASLHVDIDKRLSGMFDRGLIDEVCALMVRGDLKENLPAVRAVGYRQVWGYLKGEYDRQTMRERALIASRRLLKHQSTWMKSMSDLRCYAVDEHSPAWLAATINRIVESMLK